MAQRSLRPRRFSSALVVGLSLAAVIAGCSKGTTVGQGLGNGANGTATGGANAFDSPIPSTSPAATAFGTAAPTVAATTAAPKKTVAVATTKAAADKTTAAAPTVVKKTAAAVKTTAAKATAKATNSAAATDTSTATASEAPFAIGIYPDGASHTPLSPVNASVYGGQEVIWTNYDTVPRSVLSQDGEFMSPSIPPNGTFTYTAETTANETIDYQDGTRPYDDGQITVTQS